MSLSPCAMGQDHRPEVVLIRGGAGYWPGVSALSRDLSDHGFAPKVIVGGLYALHAGRIAADYQSGQRHGPLTIVGYSSGADFACHLCSSLQDRGVPVATLVLMESTLGTDVPGNVDVCINLYESRPATDWIPAFRGIPVQAESDRTSLMNLDVKANDDLKWLSAYSHFTIASGGEARVMLRNLLLMRQSQYLEQQTQAAGLPPMVQRATSRTAVTIAEPGDLRPALRR